MDQKLDQLQMLRYAAAMMVAVAHSIFLLEDRTGAFVLEHAHQLGRTAVSIFFLISGFIIAFTSRGDFGRTAASWQFFRRRLLRIVPLYSIFSVVAFGVAAFGTSASLGCRKSEVIYLLASLIFIPAYRCDGIILPILSQGWTLQYEIFFYALFAISLSFTRRTGMSLLAIAFCSLVLFPSTFPHYVSSSYILEFYTNNIMWLIFMGVLVEELYFRIGPITHCFKTSTLVAICLIFVVMCQEFLVEMHSMDRQILSMIGASVVVVVALFFVAPQRPPDLFSKTVRLLGDASFSIYLAHGFILTSMSHVFDRLSLWKYDFFVFLSFYLMSCSIIGVAIHLIVEKPILIRLRSITARVP